MASEQYTSGTVENSQLGGREEPWTTHPSGLTSSAPVSPGPKASGSSTVKPASDTWLPLLSRNNHRLP